jgi:hypothetical protein
LKDCTGSISVSVWGKSTNLITALEEGDCVEIKNGTTGTFSQKPTIDMNDHPMTSIAVSASFFSKLPRINVIAEAKKCIL